jgi:TRAP-type C4-dicarboxylate transport system substrate-binding protein
MTGDDARRRVPGTALTGSAACAAGAVVLSLLLAPNTAAAQDKTYTMKITLPTVGDPSFHYAKDYAAAIEKDSGGRIKTEIYGASQLGTIPRQIEGTQFGAIQCAIMPPEFFVGVDERFEVMAAPGLVDTMAHGERLAADPAVLKVMLGLGAEKGLHGVALFMNSPSSVISRDPIRTLAEFKGKKIRVLASPFQTQAISRLGATPVAMTLGDVIPAIQQGAIDGAVGGIVVWTPMHFVDTAKNVTETGQPAIYAIAEISKSWYDSLPPDLQKIVDGDAVTQQAAIYSVAMDIVDKARKSWTDSGGELISLPAAEQADMMKTFSSVGADVSATKPLLNDAYKIVTDAAQRTR